MISTPAMAGSLTIKAREMIRCSSGCFPRFCLYCILPIFLLHPDKCKNCL
nr:MAG TPA: hypothetical protein [Caudoviricetes sp.]